MEFQARELVNQPIEYLINNLPNSLNIIFEDKIQITSSKRKVIYSWYFWEFHRQYSNTPILSTHHVDAVLQGKNLASNTHRLLLQNVYETVVHTYQLNSAKQVEPLLKLCYDITNSIYNDISQFAEPDVNTIDLLDFIEISDNPIMKNIIGNITTDKNSIATAYKEALDFIKKDKSLNKNNLAQAVRSGIVNANQVNQCLVVRGYMTEVDGSVLPTPVMANYLNGMSTPYQYIAESRSAAKSYYFSEAPLEESEYFARRLQLLCMTVEKLYYEDCGSTKYLDWYVKPPKFDENGTKIYQGDISFMIGKNYLDEETGTLKTIKAEDTHLFNKTIKMRSVLTCKHPDKHGVCAVCFGELSRNAPTHANLGHLCSVTMTQQTTQTVLSTKHYDGSAIAVFIMLSPILAPYFKLDNSKTSLLLKEELKISSPRLVISKDEALGLLHAVNSSTINNINPNRISSISSIEIILNDGKNDIGTYVDITQNGKNLVMTKELLEYIKIYNWKMDSKNNFVFDLSNWNFNNPLLKLPEMEYSYSDHSYQVAKAIESNLKNLGDRSQPESPVKTLIEIFDLVNSKLWVNLAVLEVIVYAIMVKNVDSYDLARNSEDAVLGISSMIIKNRSLSAAYGYEKTFKTIVNPDSFFKLDKPDSPFDVMICPAEVVKHYQNRS